MRWISKPLVCVAIAVATIVGAFRPSAAEESSVILACNDFPPLKIEHPGADGLRGTDVEAIAEIAHRSRLNLLSRFMPWKRGYAEAADGTIDGLCSCSYREDRTELFYFSDPIGATSIGIFHPPGDEPEPMTSIADLKGEDIGKVGVVKGYNLDAELEDAKIPHLAVSGDRQAFDMLVNRRFDHLYSFRAPIDFILRNGGNMGVTYSEMRSSPYFICLSKKVPGTQEMMTRINDAIATMRQDGTFEKIQRRYGQEPIN